MRVNYACFFPVFVLLALLAFASFAQIGLCKDLPEAARASYG